MHYSDIFNNNTSTALLLQNGELVKPSTYTTQQISTNSYRRNLHVRTFKLLNHMIVIMLFWCFFIVSFYTFNANNLFILYPLRWPHGWPKHVAVNCVYKNNFSIFVCICWHYRK
jgi:hypothetical protein